MWKRRAIIAALGLVAFASLGTGQASAVASYGPFHVCTVNGLQFCLGDQNGINVGDIVTQEADSQARNIDFTRIDNNCSTRDGAQACERDYITFDVNGDYVATHDTCDGLVYVKGTSATIGIVWIQQFFSTYSEFDNQHCSSFPTLAASNNIHNAWETVSLPAPGFYYKLTY